MSVPLPSKVSRKRIGAGLATALVMVLALIGAVIRSIRDRPPGDAPEDCLAEMHRAMQAGDVSAYLRCFTGELRSELERTVDLEPPGRFAEHLRRTAEPIKGRAVLEHKSERSGPDQVRLMTDRIYEDRPWEYQAYRLRRQADGWKIYAVEPVERHEPVVPYGTAAFPMPVAAPGSAAPETH